MSDNQLPIRLLHDRVLVEPIAETGDRRTGTGLVIPATAQMGKRLTWGRVVAIGSTTRAVVIDDRVLFDPEDRGEVELHGRSYVLLRERDIHALASARIEDANTGLYL